MPVIQFVLDLGVKKSIEIAKILADEKARTAGSAVANADAVDTDEQEDDPAADEDESAATPRNAELGTRNSE